LTLVAFRDAQADQIDRLESSAVLNLDGSISVHQVISYNFQGAKRDNVDLWLPTKYSDSNQNNYKLKIFLSSVSDNVNNIGSFKTELKDDYLKVSYKMENRYFADRTIFIVDYVAEGVVRFGLNEDYFYWNATGNVWPLTIKQSVIKIILPRKIVANTDQLSCLYGAPGKELKCRSAVIEKAQSQLMFLFENPFEIFSGESTRASFTLPKGTIYEPTLMEMIRGFVDRNWIALAPFPVLIIFLILWRQRGRDPRSSGNIEIQIGPPPDLSPAEIGTVLDEKVHGLDVTAEIFYLASRGYFRITRVFNQSADDFLFTKLGEIRYSETEFQQTILNTIFANDNQVHLSELASNFAVNRSAIFKQIYESTVAKGLFPHSPAKIRALYVSVAVALALGGFYTSFAYFNGNIYGYASSILSGIFITVMAMAMPRRSKKGVSVRERIIGFKYFLIGGTDISSGALAKNQSQFENYLSYSIVLSVEKDWAYQYKNVFISPLSWYQDPTIAQNFNVMLLIDSITSCASAINNHLFK